MGNKNDELQFWSILVNGRILVNFAPLVYTEHTIYRIKYHIYHNILTKSKTASFSCQRELLILGYKNLSKYPKLK
jgi:hypothetical protein